MIVRAYLTGVSGNCITRTTCAPNLWTALVLTSHNHVLPFGTRLAVILSFPVARRLPCPCPFAPLCGRLMRPHPNASLTLAVSKICSDPTGPHTIHRTLLRIGMELPYCTASNLVHKNWELHASLAAPCMLGLVTAIMSRPPATRMV